MYNSNAFALGQWGEIVGAILPKAGGAPATSPGGTSPTGPQPSPTTISPTFQQAFTAAVSPTIQVTTDSAGARVGATTVQEAGGGQYAAGGGSGTGPGAPSGAGGMPITPLTPPSFRDEFYYPADAVREVMAPGPFNWTPVIYVVGGLAAVLLFLSVMKPRRAAAA